MDERPQSLAGHKVVTIAKDKGLASMTDIMHVTTPETWEQARLQGENLATEGSIHCCLPDQLAGVVSRYFKDQAGLVALKIDSDELTPPLK